MLRKPPEFIRSVWCSWEIVALGSTHLPQYRATCNKPCCVCVCVCGKQWFLPRAQTYRAPATFAISWMRGIKCVCRDIQDPSIRKSMLRNKKVLALEHLGTVLWLAKSSATNGHQSRSCWWEEWKGTRDTMGTTALIFWECGNCVGWAAQAQHAAVNIRRHNAMLTPKELLYLLHLCPRERVHVHPHTHIRVLHHILGFDRFLAGHAWSLEQMTATLQVHRGA